MSIRSDGCSVVEIRPEKHLYAIGARGPDGLVAHVKFGVSVSPRARLNELQTGNHRELVLVCVISKNPWAMQMERWIHILLAPYCSHGEWFEMTPEVAGLCNILGMVDFDEGCR